MKRIILSLVTILFVGVMAVSAQTPTAKKAVEVAVESLSKEHHYKPEQKEKLKMILLEREAEIAAINAKKLPAEKRTEEVKRLVPKYNEKITKALGPQKCDLIYKKVTECKKAQQQQQQPKK